MALHPDEMEKHKIYLGMSLTVKDVDGAFSEKEVAELSSKGMWLQGLANGYLIPFTEQQRSFARVFQKGSTPTTYWEKLWSRYLAHLSKQNEKDEPDIPLKSPGENWMPREQLGSMMPSGYGFSRRKK